VQDPRIGRFLSPDPIVQDPYNTQSHDRYSYAWNNPATLIDPSGFDPEVIVVSGSRSGGVPEWLESAFLFPFSFPFSVTPAADAGVAPTPAATSQGQAQGRDTELPVLRDEMVVTAQRSQNVVQRWLRDPIFCHCDVYRFGFDDFLNSLPALGPAGAEVGTNIASVASSLKWAIAARGTTTVIGKIADLKNLAAGEQSLLSRLPNLGSPKANWAQNSGVLPQEMRLGQPIRDATVDSAGQLINNTGFLRAERNLLQCYGWCYNPSSTMWTPPVGP
jgi:hypothetical protein